MIFILVIILVDLILFSPDRVKKMFNGYPIHVPDHLQHDITNKLSIAYEVSPPHSAGLFY